MINPKDFLTELSKKTSLITGVPDSALKGLSDYLDFQDIIEHVKVPNEGISLSYASGYYIAKKTPALVYLQNSGFGNLINPLTSLLDQLVYSIPCVILIGWRAFKGNKDEPQHKKMGLITEELVKTLGYNHFELNNSCDWKKILDDSFSIANSSKSPVFLLAQPKLFEEYDTDSNIVKDIISREIVLNKLYSIMNNHVIISTTGKSSRELYEINNNKKNDIFYCVGSMGHASAISLSLSNYVDRKVTCIDGDGAFLMHMGFISMIRHKSSLNFNHIIINNGLHESVGNQESLYKNIDILKIGKAAGYKTVQKYECKNDNIDEVVSNISEILKTSGPNLIELKVGVQTRSNLSRPKETPQQNLEKFIRSLS